ncbi:hypothetical protein BDV96DRAFT_616200 [Lophiotrema nucula]|uniref:Uncharacterized protein n=1 Tax=Lophiotrema nucula TaxID=690887 RepID=A0A6A5YQF1_9PLEO|nr:hypothetical protein BDV96DRAFT_616200 [Lophiotrema nucula]
MPRLAPAVSAIARSTMKIAYEDLERTITPADARNLQSTSTLAQVREAAVDIERQLAARQALRNMRRLTPLLNGLEHYAKVVDVLCNGTPFLPWIWSPITLILRVASEYIEAFEHIMKGYSRISEALTRFDILSDAFSNDHDFQQTLAVFYADILQFHKHAYKFVRRNGWKLLFLTSWGRFQRRFDNILDDLKRHGELIDLEANARDIAEARKLRQDIRSWRQESVDQVSRDDEELAAKQFRHITSWLKIDETEQLTIFDAILEETSKYSGTSSWITTHPKFRAWLQQQPDTRFLWLQGNPGTGKSVLSAELVNFLQAANCIVVKHFCTFSYSTTGRYEQILRSILLQLLRGNGAVLTHVYQQYILEKRSPSISTLEQLIDTAAISLSDDPCKTQHLWIIVDGLDECETNRQARLLSLLNQIAFKPSAGGGSMCKVLVASRSTPALAKSLRRKPNVSLSDELQHLETSIRAYVSQRLQVCGERLHQLELEPSDVEDIENMIVKRSNGMFLYARLVVDYLVTNIFYSGAELRKSIHQLPQSLADFYKKIVTQMLVGQDARSQERIKSVLCWIAFAKRPLKKVELLSAVSYSSGTHQVDRLVPKYILDTCSPLGMASIACLMSGLEVFRGKFETEARSTRLIKGIHGLHVYATEHWMEYLLADATDPSGFDPSSPLLGVATQFAHRLYANIIAGRTGEPSKGNLLNDERLLPFKHDVMLYQALHDAVHARSRKGFESEMLKRRSSSQRSNSEECDVFLDPVSRMLSSYQEAVEHLLDAHFHPGVSAEELKLFKSNFRTSAYTCRLHHCPRTTLGFNSKEGRDEHEMTHVGGFRCTHIGCQYPPFSTSQTLQSHTRSKHSSGYAPRSIRRISAFRPNSRPQQQDDLGCSTNKRDSNRCFLKAH